LKRACNLFKGFGLSGGFYGLQEPENRLFLSIRSEVMELAMKKTYWMVMSEFYDDGTVKAAMISRVCKKKPENSCRELPRMDAYHDWFESREDAERLLAEAHREGAA
jgi:hypothetical protein